MTAQEVVTLLPQLRLLSRRLAYNGCDPDDLAQQAATVLLEGRRQCRNPMVLATSVMIDYCRCRGWQPWQRGRWRLKRLPEAVLSGVAARPHHRADWQELPLTDEETVAVRLCCELGLTRQAAADCLGTHSMQVIRWLRSAATKAAASWL